MSFFLSTLALPEYLARAQCLRTCVQLSQVIMSKETTTNFSTILHSRYNHLLQPLRDLDRAAESLCDKGFLSPNDKREVQAVLTEERKKRVLCGFLTGKGVSLLVQISEALTVEEKRQHGDSSGSTSSSSCTSSTETSGGSGDCEGGRERGRGKEEGSETVGEANGQRGMEYVCGELFQHCRSTVGCLEVCN